ncbi:MAG: DUF4190 domain-containing protein [Planctomycetota bacterium]|jgi:hypothetical protein
MTEVPQPPAEPQPTPPPGEPVPPAGQPVPPSGEPAGNGLATAGMVLGIITLATCWMFCAPYVPLACGIVGLVLSVLGASKAKDRAGAGAGKAKVGIICSVIGLAVIIVIWILLITVFAEASKGVLEEIKKAQEMYNTQ